MTRDFRLSIQKNRRLIFWATQLFIWTFYFIFDVEIIHRYNYGAFRSADLHVYLQPLLFCFLGLPLTLILKVIIDWYFASQKSSPLFWILGLILPIALGIGWYFFGEWLETLFQPHGGFANNLVDFFWNVFIASMILITWSVVYLFIKFWEDWLEQKLKTEQALLLAENARLKMLRYQVNPHFLFNTLSSLRALIRKDPEQAVDMVGRISEFMRYSLGGKTDLFAQVGEEIEAIRTYIGIEQVRFGDKMEVSFEVDESAKSLLIPGFILHPIVENAVKYGMETSEMPLKVTIRCKLTGMHLLISVTNSGKWLPEDSNLHGTGTGLRNVRERLSCLYPGEHEFEIEKDAGSVKVIIKIENPTHG
ncbi:MAG: histidine kinase [Bacteroidota bacterium]